MNKSKKYELTDTIEHHGTTLYRIKALRSFGIVEAGDLGGYIQSEDNLSHEGDCWIFDNAIVRDEAKVLNNAAVTGNVQVLDHAIIKDYASVNDSAVVTGNSKVYDYARVYNNAIVYETSEVYGNAIVRGNANLYSAAKIFDTATVSDKAIITGHSKVYGRSIVIGNAVVNGDSEIYGYSIVCGDVCITDTNIYDKARVIAGMVIGSTINGDTVINIHGCLKNNAYISSIDDYIDITINGIILTFYLSKDKDIYFTFGGHEYKLGNLNSYTEEFNDIIGFPMMVELAKKYLLREKNMDCQEITDVAIKEIQETPLQQYLKETGINDNFFYEYKNCSRELTIFTKIPGVWIGFQGKGVNRLSEILNEQFGHEVDIQFKEMKGNFMSL